MEPPRPPFLDLRSMSSASQRSVKPAMRSPRLHVAGEAPPELSPLDAFALQSRLLAKQLEESNREGRRMSRLPPLTTESPLVVQGRSEYFRAMSQDSMSDHDESPAVSEPASGLGLRIGVEEPAPEFRPRSMHPRMSQMPPINDQEPVPIPTPNFVDMMRGRASITGENNTVGNYGMRREASPETLETSEQPATDEQQQQSQLQQPVGSLRSIPLSHSPSKKEGSTDTVSLVPPRSIYPRRSSSMMSGPPNSIEDDQVSLAGSRSPGNRKMSSASSVYNPHNIPRPPSVTPSVASDLPRPSFNFSRPISRAGTPLDMPMPSRQTSTDSQPAFTDDPAHTPVSMDSESFGNFDEHRSSPGSSYIYSTYVLPRGKEIQRSVPLDTQSVIESSSESVPGAPPSPPTRPSSSASRATVPNLSFATEDHTSKLTDPISESARLRTAMSVSDAASTHKSLIPTAAEMTTEEHLDKGIECHENGSLNESTYHLRIAAQQNNPTAMLLYALACRHGWGMRPNQKEGVEWLRKAAELAHEQLDADEEEANSGKKVNVMENKTRKAQFALSVYELGVSHMNGWGIEQDKRLALKCFEIAGGWGDVDALCEAGFCYAQGMGCKKNLKKSAKYYRMAEAKGMSMVGNSWIHKPKYASDDEDSKKKKGSKRRHLFHGHGHKQAA